METINISVPTDVWKIILSHLTDIDIINISFVNKPLNDIINPDDFWITRETMYSFIKCHIYDQIKIFAKTYMHIKNEFNIPYHKKYNNKKIIYDNSIKTYSDVVREHVYMILYSHNNFVNRKIEKDKIKYDFYENDMIDKIVGMNTKDYGYCVYHNDSIIAECVFYTTGTCKRIGIYVINPYSNKYHTLITNHFFHYHTVDKDKEFCTSCVIYGIYVWYTIIKFDFEKDIKYEKIIAYNICTDEEYLIIDRPIFDFILTFHKTNNKLYFLPERLSIYDPIWMYQLNIDTGKLEKK